MISGSMSDGMLSQSNKPGWAAFLFMYYLDESWNGGSQYRG